MLLANGVMTICAIFLTGNSRTLYTGNQFGDSAYVVNQAQKIYVKVIRSLDKTIADMICVSVLSLSNGDITFGNTEHIKPPNRIREKGNTDGK